MNPTTVIQTQIDYTNPTDIVFAPGLLTLNALGYMFGGIPAPKNADGSPTFLMVGISLAFYFGAYKMLSK